MNTLRITAIAMLTCLPLLACGKKDPPPPADAGTEPTTMLGKAVKEATDEARKELATENINLSATGHPDAEITPAGDLLIAGKAVVVSAEQRALLLEYRKHVNLIAEAGIGIGQQGDLLLRHADPRQHRGASRRHPGGAARARQPHAGAG